MTRTTAQQLIHESAYEILKRFTVFDSVSNQIHILNEMLIATLMDNYESMDTEKKEELHALVTFYKNILQDIKVWEDDRLALIQMEGLGEGNAPGDEASSRDYHE